MQSPDEYLSPEKITTISISDLTVFQDNLAHPWGTVARTERIRRERVLDTLRTYLPDTYESPEYEDSGKYLELARATNRSPIQVLDGMKLREDVRYTTNIAANYVGRPDTQERLSAIGPAPRSGYYSGYNLWTDRQADLTDSFASNLYGVVGTARSAALRSFEIQRNRCLRRYLPSGMDLVGVENFKAEIKHTQVTGNQVSAMEQDIMTIAPSQYRAPYPDFFQMPASQQADIVQALGNEWEELCQLLHSVDSRLLTTQANCLAAPLAYLPVDTLKTAIATNPAIVPAQLCHAFLRKPLDFEKQVFRLKRQAAIAALMRQEHAPPAADPRSKTTTNTSVAEARTNTLAEIEVMGYDHVRLTVGEKQFYMPLERPNAMLAARVLETVARAGKAPYVDGDFAVKQIWREMPQSDRELFYTKASDGNKGSAIIRAGVLDIFRKLLSPLGLTRETSGERFKIEKLAAVGLELGPPSEAELAELLPIFPPGTLRERVAEAKGDTVPDTVLAAADDIIRGYLHEPGQPSHKDALELLDFITDHYGKRALRIQLEMTGGGLPFEQAVQRLHGRVADVLAEGYRGAYLNRIIAGHIATGEHQVRHVSGRLPIRTFVSSASIKRWYIGS